MPRAPTSASEATRLIEALIARRFDGELPALSTAVLIDDNRNHLFRMPLAETLPLHGRALFASSTLDAEQRQQAARAREGFFAELGAAVGLSARVVLAAVRARRFPLLPPQPIPGYEYLGSFPSHGSFDVADPCHLRKTSRMPSGSFSLSYTLDVAPGPWHAFVRPGTGDDVDRTAELVVIHDDGFAAVAAECVATVGVDAGIVGVFDSTCPLPQDTDLYLEGIVHGLGVFAQSGYGDGMYPVYAGQTHGRVTKLRVGFFDEEAAIDATVAARTRRRYAITTTYEVGDTIDHPKFGAGTVVRVNENKVVVEFEDEPRTLIHGKR